MSWRKIFGLILLSILGVFAYSYYRLRTFSDNIYNQLAQAGVRSITVINLIRPEDLTDPGHYWLNQTDNFSAQIIEGIADLPIKLHVEYWVPSSMSNDDKDLISMPLATIEEQSRVISNLRSEDFPTWLGSYASSALSYNFLRIWALDNKADLTFYLDPRSLNTSSDPNALLHSIALGVRGIGLTKKMFEYLLIPQSDESANGVLFINKQLILSSKHQPQPDALKRLMIGRIEYGKNIVEEILERSSNLARLSFESYVALLKERVEMYLKKAGLPLKESALISWISGNTALSEYNLDYNFGDLYSQILPVVEKKGLKSDDTNWSVHLLRESLGPDADLNPLMLCILLEQDLHNVSKDTSTELLSALQNYRQELEKSLPDNQQKILKDFKFL